MYFYIFLLFGSAVIGSSCCGVPALIFELLLVFFCAKLIKLKKKNEKNEKNPSGRALTKMFSFVDFSFSEYAHSFAYSVSKISTL